MRHCPACVENVEVSEFGVDRSRRDGLNLYCKDCTRRKIAESRERSLSVKDRVILAMKRGAQTQEAIRKIAGIRDEDRLTDVLADLYDANQLDKAMLRAGVYRLAA